MKKNIETWCDDLISQNPRSKNLRDLVAEMYNLLKDDRKNISDIIRLYEKLKPYEREFKIYK